MCPRTSWLQVLTGREPGEALGLPAWDQGHLIDRVVVWKQGADNGVSGFVVRDELLGCVVLCGANLFVNLQRNKTGEEEQRKHLILVEHSPAEPGPQGQQ